MIKILNGAIYDDLMHLVENSEKEIQICAPFIKSSVVNDIFTYKKQEVKITTIINIRLMSFYRKVLDIDTLAKILSSNGSMFNYPTLHVKFICLMIIN